MIKVKNEVAIHELNNNEYNGTETISLISHWIRSELVILEIPDVEDDTLKITVAARDLVNAIKNATNTGGV